MTKSTIVVPADLFKAAKAAADSERGANLKRAALSAAFIEQGYDAPEKFRAPKKDEDRTAYNVLMHLSAQVHFVGKPARLKSWQAWYAATGKDRTALKESGAVEQADISAVTRNLSNWRQQIERYLAAQETEGEGSAPKKRVVKTINEQWLDAMATIAKQGIAGRQADDDKRGMSREQMETAMGMAANLAAFLRGENDPKPKARSRRKAPAKKAPAKKS